MNDRRPVIISGPSGVGKGTLIQMLLAKHPGVFSSTVSHTTRRPRIGEEEGKAYYFVSHEDFRSLISQNAFAEHTIFNGNHYGTSIETIAACTEKVGPVILDIEMDGVKQIKANPSINARYVFIKPPSFKALEIRLRERGTEKEEDIRVRLDRAKAELDYADVPGVHDKIIVNDELDKAYEELEEFLFGSLPQEH